MAVLDWVTQTTLPCFTTLHHGLFFFQNENVGRPSTSASETKDFTSTRPSDGHKDAGKTFFLSVDKLWQSYVSKNRDERYFL